MCLLVASIIVAAGRRAATHAGSHRPLRRASTSRQTPERKARWRKANMQGDGPFSQIPIWGVFIGTLLLVLVSVEAGYRWARYQQTRSQQEKEAPVGAMVGEAPVGAMVGATLGLL